MPILRVEIVQRPGETTAPDAARRLADAAGEVFGTPVGRTWVRLRELPASAYAENGDAVPEDVLPVFVDVLHYEPPTGDELAREVRALTDGIAHVLGCSPDNVHVLYQSPAKGRISFGGTLRE